MILEILLGVVRHVLTVLGGGLVTSGWLDNDELTKGVGAVLTLIGIGWSVWQKSRKRTEPGGTFNPRAEVRKASHAETRRRGGGIEKGHVRASVVVALALWVLAMASCVMAFRCLGGERANGTFLFPDVTETPDLTSPLPKNFSGDWLRMTPVEDKRPFWTRLLASLRVSADIAFNDGPLADGAGRAKLKGASIKGGADF